MLKVTRPISRTVAELARELSSKGEKVNLQELAKGRGMFVSSLRTDGSTIKLLENECEVDCIVMKNGKVLAAKGKFTDKYGEASELADSAMCKIANHATEGESLHCDFWA